MLQEVRRLLRSRWGTFPVGSPTPQVAIVGAGAGGLCMGARLKASGIESFTIFEKGDGVGGTWRDNTYPGAECDAKSHLYSFSFQQWPHWSKRYAEQPEILRYFEHLTDAQGLRPHLRLNTEVSGLTWHEDTQKWDVHTADGETHTVDVVVSGMGQLNRPSFPDIEGRDLFQGHSFHSARWDHDHDLAGKRVAVIGNAASAVQFIPRIADGIGRLNVFQRSPNWVFEKHNNPYSEATKAFFERHPDAAELYRSLQYLALESSFAVFYKDSVLARLMEWKGRKYIRENIDDPALQERVIPDYPAGCKRLLIATDYYPTLNRPNVELITEPIERISRKGVVTADGVEHGVDTVIYATGFDTSHFLAPLKVTGVGGRTLEEAWVDGAEAYQGVTVSGFPNLFLLYGPNTNLAHNSILFMIECQVHYTLQCLAETARRGAAALDVRPEVMAAHNADLQDHMADMVWESGCHSWYKNEAGKVINNWPRTTIRYWAKTRRLNLDDYTFISRRAARRPAIPAAVPETVGASG